MKTRKAIALSMLAVLPLWIASIALAQGTAGTVSVTPAKPVSPKAPAKATAAPTADKPASASAKQAPGSAETAEAAAPKAGGPRSIVGEVVDPACWIVNGAKGDSHRECAIACAKAGQVLAIVERKTQRLYLIATEKPGEDPNKGLIDYVGQIVLVKGRVYTRGGATGIKVASVQPYADSRASAR